MATPSLPKGVFEISLRPYVGRLCVARSRKAYEDAHILLFGEPDKLKDETAGRYSANFPGGNLTYLAYAENPPYWAHELSHVVLHLFEYVGCPFQEGGGEPFCYMLHTLMTETLALVKQP